MRTIKRTTLFKKDYRREKKGQHAQRLDDVLMSVIRQLQYDEYLPEKYSDHALTGQWKGYRDCHIKPDLVLIYQKTADGQLLLLNLIRLGSHSELKL